MKLFESPPRGNGDCADNLWIAGIQDFDVKYIRLSGKAHGVSRCSLTESVPK